MAEVMKVKEEGTSGGVSSALSGLGEQPKRIRTFFHDVRVEMNKVNWPSRSDVWSTTMVVIVTVAFFAGYFLLTDTILTSARQWLFHFFEH